MPAQQQTPMAVAVALGMAIPEQRSDAASVG
jgi:hypothetical protein